MKRFGFALLFALALTLTLSPAQAAYFNGDENPTVATEIKEDAFIGGNTVSITAPIAGELFAAGNNVSVSKKPNRSVFAAGNTVQLDQGSGYNAYVAGNNVTLAGEFGHDVYVAGATVMIEEGTVINGDLRVAGSQITLHGTVKGNVEIGGESVISDAIVGGSFKGGMTKLDFNGGSIAKDLDYKSNKDAQGLDKVTIAGKTNRQPLPADYTQAPSSKVASWFYSLLTTLIVGALVIFFLPKKVAAMSEIITTQWTRSMSLGLAALVLAPIVGFLALATLIGWKVGLAIFALYAVWLMIVPVYGLIVAGQWLLSRLGDATPNIWAALLVGSVSVSVLCALPEIGWIFMVAAFFALVLPALGASLVWSKKILNDNK